MVRLFAVAALAFFAATLVAEDKKESAPSGTWARESGGFDLTFTFAKDTLTMTIMNGDNGVVVTSSYTIDKNDLVKLKVTKAEEKGNFPGKPPAGMEASFKWQVNGKKATLSDLTGQGTEEAKGIFEGEFAAKKK